MIYPSYATTSVKKVETALEIFTCLDKLNITNKPTSFRKSIWIDGIYHEVHVNSIPENIPILSNKEFIEKYTEFYYQLHNFINNLKKGDKVIIDERRGDPQEYPYSFADEMTKWCGKEMTIDGIGRFSDSMRKYGNGSDKCFYLKEDNGAYVWHSSMFVMDLLDSITRVNLSSLKVDPLLL